MATKIRMRRAKTTCQNVECPFHSICRHNIVTEGLKCEGNIKGFNYRSRTIDLKRRIREGELNTFKDYTYAELIHDLHN